jgi:hypothetical protein
MNNPLFKHFKTQYMKEWTDVETLFLYIYMYEYIATEFNLRFKADIDEKQMIQILQLIFTSPDLRKKSIALFRQYQQNQTYPRIKNSSSSKKMEKLPSYVFTLR